MSTLVVKHYLLTQRMFYDRMQIRLEMLRSPNLQVNHSLRCVLPKMRGNTNHQHNVYTRYIFLNIEPVEYKYLNDSPHDFKIISDELD